MALTSPLLVPGVKTLATTSSRVEDMVGGDGVMGYVGAVRGRRRDTMSAIGRGWNECRRSFVLHPREWIATSEADDGDARLAPSLPRLEPRDGERPLRVRACARGYAQASLLRRGLSPTPRLSRRLDEREEGSPAQAVQDGVRGVPRQEAGLRYEDAMQQVHQGERAREEEGRWELTSMFSQRSVVCSLESSAPSMGAVASTSSIAVAYSSKVTSTGAGVVLESVLRATLDAVPRRGSLIDIESAAAVLGALARSDGAGSAGGGTPRQDRRRSDEEGSVLGSFQSVGYEEATSPFAGTWPSLEGVCKVRADAIRQCSHPASSATTY